MRKLRHYIARARFWLLNSTTSLRMQSPAQQSASQARQIGYLRDALIAEPSWQQGHLALGHAELSMLRAAEGKRDLRRVAAVRVSARAALALSANAAEESRAEKLEAMYLLAMSDFYEGQLAPALAGLSQLVSNVDAGKLEAAIYYRALEFAAAAAMPLDKRREALQYIERIPPQFRNPEVSAAYKMLIDPEFGPK